MPNYMCEDCGEEIETTAKCVECPECGSDDLTEVCPMCGSEIDTDTKVCPDCKETVA